MTTCVVTNARQRDHSYNCDMRSKGSAPYPPDRSEGPDEDDGKGDGGGKWRKGGPKGKGRNVPKKPRQAQQDRDRDMRRSRAWKGQGKRKTISARAFGRALTLSHAATTIRSTTSWLRTWDTTALQLREQGLLPNVPKGQDPSKLDPNTIKAVVAALRSQNYRSAELYLNTAYLRRKAHHEVSGQLQLAYRMATRMARRGIGPARGKAPIPIPSPEAWMYPALMVGIWHLLRVNELVSLNIEHVQRKQGPRGYQTALWIEESKTDQQKAGAMVARDCVCDGRAEHPWCPSHILWRQVCKRLGEVRGTGEDPWTAPLFTEDDGHRLTVRTVARAVGQIARKAGEPLERDGVALHGTHSLRVTGAIWAYASDIPETTIMALGRWANMSSMLRYLRGTLLVKAAGATRAMVASLKRDEAGQLANTNFTPMGLEEPDKGKGQESSEGMMVRSHTGLLHRTKITAGPKDTWVTVCGWRWAHAGTLGVFNKKEWQVCQKCFHEEA